MTSMTMVAATASRDDEPVGHEVPGRTADLPVCPDSPALTAVGSYWAERLDSIARRLDAAVIESFADAVAVSGANALMLDKNNNPDGWLTVTEAARSGRAFCVEVRPGLLALDLDDDAKVAAGSELATFLRDNGIGCVRCASGRPGHEHLWVVLPSDMPKAEAIGLFGEMFPGLRGAFRHGRMATRPPLSPHRSGFAVELIEPETEYEALAVLWRCVDPAVVEGPAIRPGPVLPGPRRELSADIAALLRDGDTGGKYTTGSALGMAVAVAAVNASWSEAEYVAEVQDPANKGGERYQEMRGGAAGALAYNFRRAERFVAANPAMAPAWYAGELARYAAAVEDYDGWPARQASVNRRVLRALVRLAQELNTINPAPSVRRLGELADEAKSTVSRVLGLLAAEGWLSRRAAGVGEPHTLALNLEVVRGGTSSISAPPGSPLATPIPSDSDAMGPGRFGDMHQVSGGVPRDTTSDRDLVLVLARIGAHVPETYRALRRAAGSEWVTVGQVCRSTGFGPQAARDHLRLLREHGLAERHGRLLHRAVVPSPKALAELVEEFRLAAHAEVLAERNRRERAEWAVDRAEWAADKAAVAADNNINLWENA